MNQKEKDTFFEEACDNLKISIEKIRNSLDSTIEKNKNIKVDLPKVNDDNKIVQQKLLEYGMQRVKELDILQLSPYFTHCIVEFDEGIEDDLYFGKFSFTDKNIYSWVTPASSLRFEETGLVSYVRTDGKKRTGILKQKDQYMISDEKIVFLATESLGHDRELVYQEYFSHQKKGFVLPEIVAQMEKAQDTVIRANHRGPLVISGPAGSGKTTLALHRVAYMLQSPDVSEQFPPTSVIVFVQDEGTRDYFSQLLPQLGIKGVTISTFAQWAMQVLDLQGYEFVYRYGHTELEKDMYEFKKYEALEHINYDAIVYKDIFQKLASVYDMSSDKEKSYLSEQKNKKILDRFDLTILLLLYKKQQGRLTMMQEYYQMSKNNAAIKKVGRFPIEYTLMIFDEFQNYLQAQIKLAKSTLEEKNNAVMYVGDMAQQTQFATIQNWGQADESISDDRQVVLQKVYRNTKNILKYIVSIGYDIDIIDTLGEGAPVTEKVFVSKDEEIACVRFIIKNNVGSIGILAKDKKYLDDFIASIDAEDRVHFMSMNEAQGVEFDVVCIVGIHKNMFVVDYDQKYLKYREDKKKIHKDLLYVALTRAMVSLHVIGSCLLKEACFDEHSYTPSQ